jgi:D-alanine-D-alanine ligase
MRAKRAGKTKKMKQKRFHKVAVLKGGPSAEREVSLRSGAAVAKGLTDAGYAVVEIDVKDRELSFPEDVDAVFVALHGEFGEDGQVQQALEARGIPYTGSDPKASRASFDKVISKQIFKAAGVPTPEYEVLRAGALRRLPLPVVVKPPRQGSSIGVGMVFEESQWMPALAGSWIYDPEALVERFVPGRELTVGVVTGEALPVVEIVMDAGYYDYAAKYTPGGSRHVVPALLSPDVTRQCQAVALQAFHALGCRGFGRVDIRMTPQGELFVLEMNNIPGFTATSLLPDAAAAAGISFPDLCMRIMEAAQC